LTAACGDAGRRNHFFTKTQEQALVMRRYSLYDC
jgi:hypothetical protein